MVADLPCRTSIAAKPSSIRDLVRHGSGWYEWVFHGAPEQRWTPVCRPPRVMIHKGVWMIPPCHIVKRWTREARGQMAAVVRNGAQNTHMTLLMMWQQVLHFATLELNNMGQYDDNTFSMAMKSIESIKNDIRAYKKTISRTCQVGYKSNPVELSGEEESGESSSIPTSQLQIFDSGKNIGLVVSSIKAPLIKKMNGRPTNKRFMSHFDATIRKGKKPRQMNGPISAPGGRSGVKQTRFCSVCHSSEHDRRKCPSKDLC